MQLTAKHKVATPVNWKHGDDVIISGWSSDDDSNKLFPEGWRAPSPISPSSSSRPQDARVRLANDGLKEHRS